MSAPLLARGYWPYTCPPDSPREICWRCCCEIADGEVVRIADVPVAPNVPPRLEHGGGCEPALVVIRGRAGRARAVPVGVGTASAAIPPEPGLLLRFWRRVRG